MKKKIVYTIEYEVSINGLLFTKLNLTGVIFDYLFGVWLATIYHYQ